MSAEYTPTPGAVRGAYARTFLQYADVAGEWFDRMIADVRREAAEKALTDIANEVLVSDWWAEDVTNSAGNVCETVREWLRTSAEAYRQERKER